MELHEVDPAPGCFGQMLRESLSNEGFAGPWRPGEDQLTSLLKKVDEFLQSLARPEQLVGQLVRGSGGAPADETTVINREHVDAAVRQRQRDAGSAP